MDIEAMIRNLAARLELIEAKFDHPALAELLKPNTMTAAPCPHCNGARRIAGLAPPRSSYRCPACLGTNVDRPTLGDLADMAVLDLPRYWEIRVRVDRDGGSVELHEFDPDGDRVYYPADRGGLEGSFVEALDFAIEQGAGS